MTLNPLADELSMVKCTPEFTAKYGEHLEPYRFVVKALRSNLSPPLITLMIAWQIVRHA